MSIAVAQDSCRVIFDLGGLDSAVVKIEAENYSYSDTLFIAHGSSITLRTGVVIFKFASEVTPDSKRIYKVLEKDVEIRVVYDHTFIYENPFLSMEKYGGVTDVEKVEMNSRKRPYWKTSSYYGLKTSANVVVFTENDSEVWVNGTKAGVGSMLIRIQENENTSIMTKSSRGSKKDWVTINRYENWEGLNHFTGPTTSSRMANKIVPGLYDLQRRRYLIGFGQITLIGGLGYFITTQLESYTTNSRLMDSWTLQYQRAETNSEAQFAYNRIEHHRNISNKAITYQRLSTISVLGIFMMNYVRQKKLEQQNGVGDPSRVDIARLPVMEYDPTTSSFRMKISRSF